MNKFAIVGLGNVSTRPYTEYYIKAFQALDIKFDVIEWDRNGICEQEQIVNATIVALTSVSTTAEPRYTKIIKYFNFTQFMRRKLKEKRYNGIIFLESISAVLCWDIIKKYYSGRYILDIRDYSYEKYGFYKIIEKKTIENSYITVISSEGYKNFLPKHPYVLAHNYHSFSTTEVNKIKKENTSKKIRITFIGNIRFLKTNKRLIKLFNNDDRFELGFYGAGAEMLQKYCLENNYYNVKFHGKFDLEETVDFYGITDLINNLYGNHTPLLDYALSNKLYNSAEFGIPILVCEDTYMAELTREYNLGIVCDICKDNLPQYIYEQYKNFSYERMEEGRRIFLKKVKQDNSRFYEKIVCFIKTLDD